MPHRYNVPMLGLNQWYNEEISSIGNLAAMEDEYLQRMYASKVVSGMNHLVKALEERKETAYESDKKQELELMMKSVKAAMEHVKNDYDVNEDNITYKWNTNESMNNKPFSATSQPINVVENNNNNNTNNNNLSVAGESLNLNELNKNNQNLRESNVLTLNELNDYIKAKTAKVSGDEESKQMEGGRRTRRAKKSKKAKKTRRYH